MLFIIETHTGEKYALFVCCFFSHSPPESISLLRQHISKPLMSQLFKFYGLQIYIIANYLN